ncbi:AzlD domain-containing protein [Bacillus sp. FJAT-42376]|uniref:AzlD domain-containing protein n=1 Tax=Bacillus sp. FJAT-42376 TaxID=2014076 RepID=UPI000F504C69|nr:AzlD domain-containing protein [Bacillus sp. FJAT-42376]AZB42264.1 AzlD domain-containing protein [Bacillus sp. FJAT-42376]
MNESIILLILAMGAVTYIPRLVPFLLFRGAALPDFLQNVLKNVPYAILGALIVPAVFMTDGGLVFGAVGALAAFAAGYLGWNVILVVLSSILACLGYGYFFG